jgi:zinc protease
MTSIAIDLPFTKRTLANGLDVIVHEDHHLPIVAVNVWYHVGSKNERPGRTGFAHLFEHLMFEGSEHHNTGYFPPLQQAGALVNGSTNTDRTNYWEVVPTSAIDRALWMESDQWCPAAGVDPRAFREPARRRPERAPSELRESAVRDGRDGDLLGAVSA